MFVNTSTAINNLKTGRVKVLGVAGAKRVAALGNVPTFREAGVTMRNDVVSIFGLAAPRGITVEVAAKLNADINAAMNTPEVRSRFETLGIEVVTESGAHATQRLTKEIAAWVDVIRDTGITAS
jgi:tripartite-type tricarboxylate transporter receptor subunit TctC